MCKLRGLILDNAENPLFLVNHWIKSDSQSAVLFLCTYAEKLIDKFHMFSVVSSRRAVLNCHIIVSWALSRISPRSLHICVDVTYSV